MRLTRLRKGNAQFPEERGQGDVVTLPNGDIFCFDGEMWQLVGGRFVPRQIREAFLWYVESGWPDADSARFDLPSVLDMSNFVVDVDAGDVEMTREQIAKWVGKFADRIVEVAERCEKINLRSS